MAGKKVVDKWLDFIRADAEGFGHVRWTDDDLQGQAQEVLGRTLTKRELEQVKSSYYIRHIDDTMIEAGWENIRLAVQELQDA